MTRRRPIVPIARLLLALLLPASLPLAGTACERSSEKAESAPTTAHQTDAAAAEENPEPPPRPTQVEDALVRLEKQIRFREERGAETGGWLHYGYLAHAYLARARLTGSLEDYAAARDALEQGFERADEGSGPYLARAAYHLAVNQVTDVPADLDALENNRAGADAGDASVVALRGDVAFRTGDLDAAAEAYREEERVDIGIGSALRMAKYYLAIGDREESRQWYDRAISRAVDQTGQRALAMLRRGDVDLRTGRPKEALKWYRKAEKLFTGWYLVDARIAEAHLRLGESEQAIERYTEAWRQAAHGQYAAGIATAYEQAGDAEQAEAWHEKATDAFDRDLGILPSVVRPEAVEYFCQTDPARAVELARASFEAAPGHAERVRLARAMLLAGEPHPRAFAILEPTLQSDWVDVELFATAAVALRDSDPERATRLAKRATAFDPDAVLRLEKSLPE